MLHRFKTFETEFDSKKLVDKIVSEAERQAHMLEELANEMGMEVFKIDVPNTHNLIELWLSPYLRVTARENYSKQTDPWEYVISGLVPRPQKTYADAREVMTMLKKYYQLHDK